MFWFPLLLSLTIALAVGLALVGRIAARAFRIDVLDGDEPEHWLAAMLFGAGLVTLLCGWCSYSGLSARDYRWLILGLLAALAGVVIVRRDGRRLLRFGPSAKGHLIVGGILVVRVGIYLLPVLFGGSHLLISDAMVYVPAADWLSRNGFGMSLSPDPDQPIQSLMVLLHAMSHRMGPMFLHSAAAVSVPELGAFELFPVMIGLGTILNLGAVYLICRWSFELARPIAAAGLLLLAILSHTLASSTTGTFLCQVYGTAVLGTAIALMPVLTDPRRWTPGNALLVGCLIAFQLSMYSELAPVLALTGLGWLAINMVYAVRTGAMVRFGNFLLEIALFTALIANVEIVRCWRGVLYMLKLNGVGCHMPWTLAEFVEFAFGGSGYDIRFGVPFRGLKRVVCTMPLLVLFVGGIWELTRRRGTFVAIALGVLAALFAYFACCRLDPWTGATGHTWNLFKIAKWAYPLVAAVQIAGLASILRIGASRRTLAGCAVAFLGGAALLNLQQHYRASRLIANQSLEVSANESPYSAVQSLRDRLAESGDPIYFVRAPEIDFKGPLMVSLLYPRSIVNGWLGDPLYGTLGLLDDRPRAFGANTVYFQHGEPPFDAPLERLPFHISRLDPHQPTMFQITCADRQFVPKVDQVLSITGNGVTCWIFATRNGVADLRMEFTDGSISPQNAPMIAVNEAAPIDALKNPLVLRPGINRVVLTASSNEIRVSKMEVIWRLSHP
jgi:hypothetical protein